MDTLVELPIEKWPLLQNKLKNLWPFNVPGYYTLHLILKYPGVREAFKFKVYCPYGNMDYGFVAFNEKDKSYPEVIMFSTTEDTSKVEEAVLKTKLIDWSKGVFFDLVTSLTLPAIERMKAILQFEKYKVGHCKMYFLEGSTKPFNSLRLPHNTYLSSVKPEHLQRVDETWPYANSSSHAYFTTLVSNGLSYGLYSSETNELLAWIFLNEFCFLCHLYCEEKHRKHGYGEYVIQCAVNDLLKDGNDVYAYVVDGNEKPLRLFAKFGFKAVDDAAYVYINL